MRYDHLRPRARRLHGGREGLLFRGIDNQKLYETIPIGAADSLCFDSQANNIDSPAS